MRERTEKSSHEYMDKHTNVRGQKPECFAEMMSVEKEKGETAEDCVELEVVNVRRSLQTVMTGNGLMPSLNHLPHYKEASRFLQVLETEHERPDRDGSAPRCW